MASKLSIEEYAHQSTNLCNQDRYLLSVAISLKRIADMMEVILKKAEEEDKRDGMG